MADLPPGNRPRLFDDLAGIAGGAVSALAGLKDEAETMVRARVDEALRRLDLVRREEFEAVAAMAARAREGQEAAEARLTALEEKLEALTRKPGGGGPGMIA
jgi:BMFP domain-containing protein YqiC